MEPQTVALISLAFDCIIVVPLKWKRVVNLQVEHLKVCLTLDERDLLAPVTRRVAGKSGSRNWYGDANPIYSFPVVRQLSLYLPAQLFSHYTPTPLRPSSGLPLTPPSGLNPPTHSGQSVPALCPGLTLPRPGLTAPLQ